LIVIPYKPVLSDSISMKDDKICKLRATVGVVSLQHAKSGQPLIEQLEIWDEFINSKKPVAFTHLELIKHRNLIIFSWEVSKKYRNLKPTEFGKIVYAGCAGDKSLLDVKA